MPPFKSGLVVSADPLASRAGLNILKKGGNAIDAAITAAHVLGVTAPAFSGVGGGGFALIWLADERRSLFIDFREKAPSAATENMYEISRSGKVRRNENAEGYRAVAVPGSISGHALLLEKYGTLRFSQTFDHAIRIARRGFRIGRALAYTWKRGTPKLRRFKESKRTYLRNGRSIREGSSIALPSLSKSLTAIRREGPQEVYRGTIARRIVEDMSTNKGLLTAQDLEEFTPTFRDPLRGTYKDYEIISAPPPSCGGALILEALNILEDFPLKDYGNRSTHALHMIAEVLGRGNLNCRTTIADPAFSNPPIDRLISKSFAKEMASNLRLDACSIPSAQTSMPAMPDSNTTHLVAIDANHNVVSLTESLECYFGSGITVSGTGILLNDTMHDFEPRPGMPNSVAPVKIPLSSMSPTIVLQAGHPVLALGAAGGPRIVSATFESLLNVIEYGFGLDVALAEPRIHLNESHVELEEPLRPMAKELRRLGHSVEVKKRMGPGDTGLYFGGVHAGQIKEDSSLVGAADPRRDGFAAGF